MPTVNDVVSLTKCGFNVIPILPKSKTPALDSWKDLQERLVTDEEIQDWWGRYPELNVAVVTGSISGVVVVDVDDPQALAGLPPTRMVSTPNGGYHLYYKHPGGRVRNGVKVKPGIDIRGDGGYVVAPPSELENGHYTWIDASAPLAEFPLWLLEKTLAVAVKDESEEPWYKELLQGVPVGQRDNAAIRLAGRWIRRGLSDEEVLALLLTWNRNNKPPMGEHPGDQDAVEWAKAKINSVRNMEEQRKPRLDELIQGLKDAESHDDKIRIIKKLDGVIQNLDGIEREYYLEQARKAGGLTKTALQRMLQELAASRDATTPVPLDEPRRAYIAVSQDFYKGVFYYGLWLPTNPRACTPDEFTFKLVTTERSLLDPPKGLPLPTDYARWSVDKETPYNVFEWLSSGRGLDAAELLDEISSVFAEFMWYPHPETPFVLALWVMSTYVYMCFDSTSYLAFVGTRRTGKSRTLTLLEKLCYNALSTVDISTAALARAIGMGQCTALVDEAEFTSSPIVIQGGVDDRLSVLLSSYQRGKLRIRSEGDSHTPRGYDPYSPKAFATMNRLPDALADRAILVKVGRAPTGTKVEDLVLFEQEQRLQLLRNKLYFFGLTYATHLANNVTSVLPLLRDLGITNRERELWLVPACIAYTVGGMGMLQRLANYATACMMEKLGQEQGSYTTAVIWACWKLLSLGGDDEDGLAPVEVVSDGEWYMRKTLRRVVAEYLGLDEKQVSAERVGRELVSTGIIDNTRQYRRQLWKKHVRGEWAYFLRKDRVMDAVVRYDLEDLGGVWSGAAGN